LDTKDGGTLQKNAFELLGTGNGLKCDANGEMKFYVYVENYSTTESVFYHANINFVGTGEQTAPFSTVTNPSFEFTRTAEEVSSPSINLLTFKIKSTTETGLNANTIRIDVILQSSVITNLDQYTSGTYTGMNYIEMGNAPQSYAGTATEGDDFISATLTEPSKTWIDGSSYYIDDNNQNIQYVLKNSKYYLVEPVRWIITADGRYDGIGELGKDYFANKNVAVDNLSSNQLFVVSEKILSTCYHATNQFNTI